MTKSTRKTIKPRAVSRDDRHDATDHGRADEARDVEARGRPRTGAPRRRSPRRDARPSPAETIVGCGAIDSPGRAPDDGPRAARAVRLPAAGGGRTSGRCSSCRSVIATWSAW